MSNSRNHRKAANCPQKPVGMTKASTSQKATISSQTMLPWSCTPMSRAVRAHAHRPTRKPPAMIHSQVVGAIHSEITTNDSQP
ncbi:hypothetical protein D3C87_1616260 [compost metagenome]